jgi:UDP-N-acetylmuramoyl-tripeptide--D-alanyl-D-alanine ligase
MRKILKFWLSKEIPDYYLKIKLTGNGFIKDTKNLIYFYFIHPVKRRIAKYYLVFLKTFSKIKIIAITGSSGKSTTKEMLSSILRLNGNTVYSFANIDPVYNIPTTVLKCNLKTKYLILEYGVEYPGEMNFYLWMAKPDIGIITSINPTHLEFFKSVDGVFNEKIKLAKYLIENNKKVFLNKENTYLRKFGENNKNVIFYGEDSSIKATNLIMKNGYQYFDIEEDSVLTRIKLSVLGKINVENSLAAYAVADSVGINKSKIIKGLSVYKPLDHRLSIIKIKNSTIIDDSYNNNPVAAEKAIEFLKEYSNGKSMVVVFGDMLELGKHSYKFHKKIGEMFLKLPLIRLICVGELSKTIYEINKEKLGTNNAFWVSNETEVDEYLTPLLKEKNTILVKGSHSIGLDRLIARLSK